MHRIQVCTESTEALVAFKFSMDFPENEQICNFIDLPQLIDQNIENFVHLKVLVKALFQGNYIKSVISLISLKSGDFIILVQQTVEGSPWKIG